MKTILYIFLILASGFSFAQVTLESDVNTKDARVNSPVVFTIVLEVSGDDLVQETPVKLPDFSKFDFDQNASEQNTYIDPVKNIRINKMAYQFYLYPKQAGNVRIGSALVKINGKMYKTEPIDIVVKEAEKKPVVAINNPAKNMYLNMQVDEKEVYNNEPVVAVLKAYSKNMSNFHNLEPAKIGFSKNLYIKSIADFDESIEENPETDFSSQVIAMFVIIPKVTGNLDIPASEVKIGKTELVSNRVKINVKKLPEGAPVGYKNAVGKYNVNVELIDKGKENFEINKAFNIAVKVSGNGNLSPSLLPKILPSSDFDIFEPKILNSASATPQGLIGEVEAQYVIVPKVRGDIKIATEDFSYFDPNEEKYFDIGQKVLMLTAVNSQDIANSKSTLQKVNEYTNQVLEQVDSPVINTKNLKIKEHKTINWKVILMNLSLIALLSLLFAFVSRKYSKNKKKTEERKLHSAKPISNIAETEAAIRNNIRFDLDSQIHYLETVKTKTPDEFFKALESFFAEANQYCQTNFSADFPDYLKTKFGLTDYEKYKQLVTKTEIEKYSPFSTSDALTDLISDVKEVYSLLEK